MTISPDVATTPQSFGVRLRAMASGPNSFAYLIILPAIVLRLTYSIVPLVQTVWMSFTNRSITNPGQFIGLANYECPSSDALAQTGVLISGESCSSLG